MALSFSFDTSKGETPQSIARKREMADALMGRRNQRVPQNVGEAIGQGLSGLGDALSYRRLMAQAAMGEKTGQESAQSAMAPILKAWQGGGTTSGGTGASVSAPAPQPADAATSRINSAFAAQGQGSGDAQYIRDGLIKRGLPAHVADGFVMNFKDESGLNAGINEKNPVVPGSRGGYGLYQLTGPRRRAYEAYAAEKGIPVNSADGQLDFMMSELQGPEKAAFGKIMATGNAGEAGAAIVNSFLRPAEDHRASRAAKYMGASGQPVQVASNDPSIGMPQPPQQPNIAAGLTPEAIAASQARMFGGGQQGQDMPPANAGAAIESVFGPAQGLAQSPQQAATPPQARPQQPQDGFTQMIMGDQPQQQPVQVADASGAFPPAPSMPQQGQQQGIPLDQLLQAAQNPWVANNPLYSGIVNTLVENQLKMNQPIDPVQKLQMEKMLIDKQKAQLELDAARNPKPKVTDTQQNLMWRAEQAGLTPGTPEYQQFMLGGGDKGITINNQMGGGKFDEKFAEGDAKAIGDVSTAGMSAQRNIGRIDQLEQLLATSATGLEGVAKQKAGEWGINLEGVDGIQAAQALINSLVPEQRQPGSGPMSDADLALFKQSLPRIINQPGGNQLIINTMRGIAQYDAQGAAIVQQLRSGKIDRATAFDMLQTRANPLAGFGGQAQTNAPRAPVSIGGYTIEQVE